MARPGRQIIRAFFAPVCCKQLESHLKDAARNTKKKTYHKIHDAEGLLKIVSLDTVCAHSEWCRRLRRVFEEITAKQ